jgi:hypothetical protein
VPRCGWQQFWSQIVWIPTWTKVMSTRPCDIISAHRGYPH